MTKKESSTLHLRLLRDIDATMRQLISRRGDVRRIILGMFKEIDLKVVEVPAMAFDHQAGKARATTILNLPYKYHSQLKRISKDRECSMNALVNGGIRAYTSTAALKSKRQGRV